MAILQDHVLVLNKHFLAIQVCTVKDAICILYKEHAKVVDDNYVQYTLPEWVKRCKDIAKTPDANKYAGEVHSPSTTFFAPQVIYLPYCDTTSSEIRTVKYSRKNVFVRDNNTCQYCGRKRPKDQLTLDHIIPRSKGGKNSFENIVTACRECNAYKADNTPEEAGMALIKKPGAPKWKSHVGTPFSKVKRTYWENFLR